MGLTPKYIRLRARLRNIATRDSWYTTRSDREQVAHAERAIARLTARIDQMTAERAVFLAEVAAIPASGSTRAPLPAGDGLESS